MISKLVCLGVALLGFVACGSDDSGKKMSDLTTEEAKAECRNHKEDFDAVAKVNCTISALQSTSAKDQCESAVQTCAASLDLVDCESADAADTKSCSATVAEVANCLDTLGAWARAITCDTDVNAAPPQPTCLDGIAAKCPLFGGDPGASG